MPAEDGEEAEDFDAEEREGEDVCCGGKAGGEHGGGHEGCVGGEGCWEPKGGGGGLVGIPLVLNLGRVRGLTSHRRRRRSRRRKY